jgi:hypothetical protein
MGNKITCLASCLILSDQQSYILVDGNILSRVSNSLSSQAHLKMAGGPIPFLCRATDLVAGICQAMILFLFHLYSGMVITL